MCLSFGCKQLFKTGYIENKSKIKALKNANFDGNVVIAKVCYFVGKSVNRLKMCIKWCVCAVCSPSTYNMCESCADSGFVFCGNEAENAI